MSSHTYKVYGMVSLNGDSTVKPFDGTGAVGSWSLDTNPPVIDHFLNGQPIYKEVNNLHIDPSFTKHNISILVYEDFDRTKLVTPTAGTIKFEVTDNGIDWGDIKPDTATFNGTGLYNRASICAPISNLRVTITGLRPDIATGTINPHGVYVEILIHSSN